MNMKQHHVHITNKSNYVMSFARGIISSRLKKINICLYLVLATSAILGSVLVLPFQKQWQENWRVLSSGLPTQRTVICDLQILCERTGLIQPTEEESKGQFNCNLQNLKGNYKTGGPSVFFVMKDSTVRTCGHRTCLGSFSLDIRKTFFIGKPVQQ